MEMIVRIKKRAAIQFGYLLMILMVLGLALVGVSVTSEFVLGGNVTNQTVIARVNVSNTEPTVNRVAIDDPLDAFGNIQLDAGNRTVVTCNVSYFDPNEFTDIVEVNATLYYNATGDTPTDDNNTHYTNTTCVSACEVIPNSNNRNGTCGCQFAVEYFANPGLWQCNATIKDAGELVSIRNSTLTNLNELLGIEVESFIIDYGNVSASLTSQAIPHNITNAGNVPLNVSVRGYGGSNESQGQNVTMICDPALSSTNISFGAQRLGLQNNTPFEQMQNLTNQSRQINVTIPQRTDDGHRGNSTNTTYWRLRVPLGAGGICNGTIIFGAIQADVQ